MGDVSIENVSDTALWVAAFRAKESARPDALYQDPLAERLAGERGLALTQQMPFGRVLAWVMAVRTVAIDRLIRQAIDDGIDTVINLGAGLDARPYRMGLPEKLRWVEVDFPHLIKVKNEKLAGETPKCDLQRIAMDLSDRKAAGGLYRQLGQQTRKALIITEGVVAYLTPQQAADLADDLRAIPTFRYWLQDYRNYDAKWSFHKSLKEKMVKAPMKFDHPDALGLFAEHGWKAKENISAVEEGERLGRRFPVPFPFNVLVRIAPKRKLDKLYRSMGYVLLEKAN